MSGVLGPIDLRKMVALKAFQADALTAAISVIVDTCEKIETDPSRRFEVALAQGVTLLRSPTASGKTLTVGRTMQQLVGSLPRRTVWFWFTPYSGLVTQTRDALAADCRGLRMRDVRLDRQVKLARDGDVYITTWASVAAANKLSRTIRKPGEEAPTLDIMIASLRAEGFYVGAVVDEAHVNFGTTAKQAAAFYLDVLRPDFTFLVTATPKDTELELFRQHAKIGVVNRIEVSRDKVVRACLNKIGIKAIHFRADERDERLLDMQEVAVFAGVERHRLIKAELASIGVSLTPLLMIQVDNVAQGQPDPVDRVREMLTAYGVSADAVAVHTSGEPDPFFHTLSYDETKEVLIFKMAAATGFDAPRAWTLVSLRQVVGAEFGLQILGRIMRVHHRLQPLHVYASDPPREVSNVLDFGYVFLANSAAQSGIVDAATDLKAIQDNIATVTDNVVVVDFGNHREVLLDPKGGFSELLIPRPDAGPPTLAGGMPPSSEAAASQVAALRVQTILELTSPDVADPDHDADDEELPKRARTRERGDVRRQNLIEYPLRQDIAFPRRLSREVMPKTMNNLVECMAQQIVIDDSTLNLITRTRGKVSVRERDVFGSDEETIRTENVLLSAARIAHQSQLAFKFNGSLDERDLKPALLKRLRVEVDRAGRDEMSEKDLRRAVDLVAMAKPHLLVNACRSCLAQVVEIHQDVDLPQVFEGPPGLDVATKSLYGVFPDRMNLEELSFARLLDNDASGTVLWWLRNVSQATWAVSIVLPNGKRHFPDFVVGVNAARKSEDHIALTEVKDDGTTGRLFSTKNTDKVRTEHSRYGSALMLFRDDGEWRQVAYQADTQRHVAANRFVISDLIWTK